MEKARTHPPMPIEIAEAILEALRAGKPVPRSELKARLERDRFGLTRDQTHLAFNESGSLWTLRLRHAFAELAKAGLISIDGKERNAAVRLTDAGAACTFRDEVAAALRDSRAYRAKREGTNGRKRLGLDLPRMAEIEKAALEAIRAKGPISNKDLAEAVAQSLAYDRTQTVVGPRGHDMFVARISSASARLHKAGLTDRIGNGRKFMSVAA